MTRRQLTDFIAANGNTNTANAIKAWNTALVTAAANFQTKHSDVTSLVYDSWYVNLTHH